MVAGKDSLTKSYMKRLKIAKPNIGKKAGIDFFMDKVERSFIESFRTNKSPNAGGET
jgi:hypothetical protein